jgi:uncharacterized FlaG/YvyC family protein
MSFDIAPVGPQQPATGTGRAESTTGDRVTNAKQPVVSESVTVDTIPSSPPQEVLDAMGRAARAHQQLQSSGRELRFNLDRATGKLTVEVHDINGNVLFTVPASKALEVAAGGSL